MPDTVEALQGNNVSIYLASIVCNTILICMMNCMYKLASFPGSPHTRIKNRNRFSVLQATESWAGPGNEAIYKLCSTKMQLVGCS